MTHARRRILLGLAIIILFLFIAIALTRPLLTKGHDATISNPEDPIFQAWVLAWDIHELGRNPLNLFNANIYYPNRYTLAYSDSQLPTAILAIPFLAITHNPIQSANLMLIFHFFLCSLGAYLLTKHLTRSRIAGVIAGIAFAYAPYKIAHLTHLNLCAAGWIPLTILFLHLYCEKKRPRDAFLAALFFTIQALSAWYYGLMLALGILLFLIVRLITNRKTFTFRWTAVLAVALILAILAIIPFALPYLKSQRDEPLFERPMDEVAFYSADVQDFLLAPKESLVWGEVTSGLRKDAEKRGNPTERAIFPGLIPLILGIGGAVYLFRRRKTDDEERFSFWFYVILLAVSAILCLGVTLHFFGNRTNIPLPFRVLYYIFPGFKAIRVPARFAIFVALALAVLSGFAVKGLVDWLSSRRGVLVSSLVSLLIFGLLIVDLMPIYLPMYKVPLKDEFPKVYTWLGEQEGEAPTVELPLAKYDPKAPYDLDTDKSWLELEPWRTYYSTLHWKKLLNGYSGFIPSSYTEAVRLYKDFPSKESMDYFKDMGIEYIILHGKKVGPAAVEKMKDWDKKDQDIKFVTKLDSDYVYQFTRTNNTSGRDDLIRNVKKIENDQ